MKTLFYTLCLLIVISSCSSIDKMVERGEYDKAFHYALNKLNGKKSKKTEHVIGLEKAYHKLNALTLREIDLLDAKNQPAYWSQVAAKYREILYRQNRVEAYLPLVSKDGYEAHFDFKNYNTLILEAEDQACAYHFENGKKLLAQAEKNKDKTMGRKAYDEFALVSNLRSHYNDVHVWRERAHRAGVIQVAMRTNNQLIDFHSFDIERKLMNLPLAQFNKKWVEFGIESESFKYVDFVIIVDLQNILFSPEREQVERYTENKEILIRTDRFKEKRDSVDVWVEKEIYENISATITDVYREKISELNGQIRIIDTRTQQNLNVIPVNIVHTFDSFGSLFHGDERALSEASKKKLKKYLEPFPSDYFLANQMAVNFGDAILNHLGSFNP